MKIEGYRKARWYMGIGKGKVVEMIPTDHAKQECISVKDGMPLPDPPKEA